jgi:hypothetical protein
MWVARDRLIYTYPGEPWGFDNGAYRDWQAGVPFNAAAFEKALGRAVEQTEPPLLAVLPDIPDGGLESFRLSESWIDRLPDRFPWYLAVQDRTEPADAAPFLGRIDGIFLGGTNTYKATAGEWCEWAHGHGLPFHYGRSGTWAKIAHAFHVGADSIDSTTPSWEEPRWREFLATMANGPRQKDLFWV